MVSKGFDVHIMFTCLKQAFQRQSSTANQAAGVQESSEESSKKSCCKSMGHNSSITFPPPGYSPTPVNFLLANALDLTAPASDALLRNRKNAWIQLAGHAGNFAPAGSTTIWKKQTDGCESKCYEELMKDSLRLVVPKYYRQVEYNDDIFIELEDLLQHFTNPSIMDVKMGSRTFLESEVTNQKLRPDLYEKMVKLDPNEPTTEEHQQAAITKLRYMQYRERGSSTATLGFRIDAMKIFGESPCKDLKKVRTRDEVRNTLIKFIGSRSAVYERFLERLVTVRTEFEKSKYFKHHEVIGSSLLLLYDEEGHAGVWIIDFAKTTLVKTRALTHRAAWQLGNSEDGFLMGLDNLIQIISDIIQNNSQDGADKILRSPSSASKTTTTTISETRQDQRSSTNHRNLAFTSSNNSQKSTTRDSSRANKQSAR